jgi:hypothetical protein
MEGEQQSIQPSREKKKKERKQVWELSRSKARSSKAQVVWVFLD